MGKQAETGFKSLGKAGAWRFFILGGVVTAQLLALPIFLAVSRQVCLLPRPRR